MGRREAPVFRQRSQPGQLPDDETVVAIHGATGVGARIVDQRISASDQSASAVDAIAVAAASQDDIPQERLAAAQVVHPPACIPGGVAVKRDIRQRGAALIVDHPATLSLGEVPGEGDIRQARRAVVVGLPSVLVSLLSTSPLRIVGLAAMLR